MPTPSACTVQRSSHARTGPPHRAIEEAVMAKGNKNRSKKNKPKLTIQEKKAKKDEKRAAKKS
jgi:hypothetical protein